MDTQTPAPSPTPPVENVSPQNPVEIPPSQKKPFLTGKIILLIVILLILFGAGGIYLALNSKTLPGGRQAKPAPIVPQNTLTPTSTPIDETASWKTYANKLLGIFLKVPPDYTIEEHEGTTLDDKKINTSVIFKSPDGKLKVSVIKNFFGGISGVTKMDSLTKQVTVDGHQAEKTYFDESGYAPGEGTDPNLPNSSTINLKLTSGDEYTINVYWNEQNYQTYDHTFDQILSTFKFTE